MDESGLALDVVKRALKQFWVTHGDELERYVPSLYACDTFSGPMRSLGKDQWIIGKWHIYRDKETILARVDRVIGQGEGEWAEEALEVELRVSAGTANVIKWSPYLGSGTMERS